MRQFVIRSLATTGVIAGLLFTGAGVATAQPEDDGSYDQPYSIGQDLTYGAPIDDLQDLRFQFR
jgi:hypothetical protein